MEGALFWHPSSTCAYVHPHVYTNMYGTVRIVFPSCKRKKRMLTKVDFLYITYSTDLYRIMCGEVSLLELMTIIL